MSAKLKIIGYCRESTEQQAKYGFNLDDQEKKIKTYVDIYYEKGTYSLEIFRDEGASAKSLNRPKMNKIMEMIRRKEIDVLVIHNLDRLTRKVRDLADLLDVLKKNDIALVSITEQIDTKTPMGLFFIYLIVLVAQWEWETISSRSVRGIEESARQGNYAIAGAPVGYRRNPENNRKLIVEPAEASIVKQMFLKAAYEDCSPVDLKNWLNSEKILNRYWSDETVRKILSNKIYYGTFSRFGVDYPNHTIPIIDEDLFNLVRQRLNACKKSKMHYVYKGLVVCSKCGQRMVTHCGRGSSGTVYLYYQCLPCGGKQISEKKITKELLPVFDQILKESAMMANIEELKRKYADLSEVLSGITESMVRDGADIELLADLYHLKGDELKQLDYCIRKLQAGYKNVSFMDLPFHEKREFLLGRVSKIKCDYISKAIDLELKEEDDSGEEIDLEDEDE